MRIASSFPMSVYICYVSGPSGSVCTTSHFVLAGIAIPAVQWKKCNGKILGIKSRFELEETERYVHLTGDGRNDFLKELCDEIATWTDARLFAEASDKSALAACPTSPLRLREDAFTQVLCRFQAFLVHRGNYLGVPLHGLIVKGNNGDADGKITNIMRHSPKKASPWMRFDKIVEAPLLVDIRSASMMQIADVCSYAVQRFFENGESDLFDRIYPKFDRAKNTVVGIRHYTAQKQCLCKVCIDHRIPPEKKWIRGTECHPA